MSPPALLFISKTTKKKTFKMIKVIIMFAIENRRSAKKVKQNAKTPTLNAV